MAKSRKKIPTPSLSLKSRRRAAPHRPLFTYFHSSLEFMFTSKIHGYLFDKRAVYN